MHTHISAIPLIAAFLGIVTIGTLWRLISAHLASSANENLNHIGKAMAFQY